MTSTRRHFLSRRGFCLCCLGSATFAATGGWLTPRQAFAEARNIVDSIRDDAARAPIKVHKLRRDVSIFEGSGGNIAVLTGSDGKRNLCSIAVHSWGIRPRRAAIDGSLGPMTVNTNPAPTDP